jgi:hypothetical protein
MITSWVFRDTAFVAAAAALGACSSVPLPSSPLASDGSPLGAAARAQTTACAAPPGFAFHGPCSTFALTQDGGTASVPADGGYAFAYVFPKNAVPGSIKLSFGTAMRAQIGRDPQGNAFPAYTGSGTPFLYVVGVAPRSVKPFAVDGPTQIVLTNANGFPGKTCVAAALYRTTWHPAPARARIAGTTLTVTLTMKTTEVTKGKSYLAFACR